MTDQDFLSLLSSIHFPQRYWELCDRFPIRADFVPDPQWKQTIIAAFREMGVDPRYDPGDQCFICEEEEIAGFVWDGMFCRQRNGVELIFSGQSHDTHLGSNFAVLAYDATRLTDPTFRRDRFTGPKPYPRPCYNGDPTALTEIVKEFVVLVRLIKDAIRNQESKGQLEPGGPG